MSILVNDKQDFYGVSVEKILYVTQNILAFLRCSNFELSIIIINNFEMFKLNNTYFNKVIPSNVITFSMLDNNFLGINYCLMGDIIVSAEIAELEGRVRGVSFFYRFVELIIHGILHLIGYNHASKKEYVEMKKESKRLLTFIKDVLNIIV